MKCFKENVETVPVEEVLTRFFSAYILTGIGGSVASLYWHDLTISAGASGAIFGMYGVFLAILTTNLIERLQEARC